MGALFSFQLSLRIRSVRGVLSLAGAMTVWNVLSARSNCLFEDWQGVQEQERLVFT